MWKFLQIEIFATNLCCTFILNMFQSQAERLKVVEEELVEVKQDLTRLKEQLKTLTKKKSSKCLGKSFVVFFTLMYIGIIMYKNYKD